MTLAANLKQTEKEQMKPKASRRGITTVKMEINEIGHQYRKINKTKNCLRSIKQRKLKKMKMIFGLGLGMRGKGRDSQEA